MKNQDGKRTEAISIRLTQEEMRKIEKEAEKEFDFPSSWIRKKIFRMIENENKNEKM